MQIKTNGYTKDIKQKRDILFSAKVRFSPTGKKARLNAIKTMLEDQIACCGDERGCSEYELKRVGLVGLNKPLLRSQDIQKGLDELIREGRVKNVGKKIGKYLLDEKAKREIEERISVNKETYENVTRILFNNAIGGWKSYNEPFIDLLCIVFSKLGEGYVNVIMGKEDETYFNMNIFIEKILVEVTNRHEVPDVTTFKIRVYDFFKKNDKLFNEIKLNMAQNFYVIKAIGIDKEAQLLNQEKFKNADLYVDTNVLIHASLPDNPFHSSFKSFLNECKSQGANIYITQKTIDEFRDVVLAQLDEVKKIFPYIPEGSLDDLNNFIIEAYRYAKSIVPDLSIENYLKNCQNPEKLLEELFDFNLVDSKWFDENLHKKEVQDLIDEFTKSKSSSLNKKSKTKSKHTATHDSLLINWIIKEETRDKEVYLMTLDYKLVNYKIKSRLRNKYIVIPLDALLQWSIPYSMSAHSEEHLAQIFSSSLKYHVLPRHTFFNIDDFSIFAQFRYDINQLPQKDIEDFAIQFTEECGDLDQNKPDDLEKIREFFDKFNANPSRIYKKELKKLEDQHQELDIVIAATNREIEKLNIQDSHKEGVIKKLRDKIAQTEIAKTNSEIVIDELKSKIENYERNELYRMEQSGLNSQKKL